MVDGLNALIIYSGRYVRRLIEELAERYPDTHEKLVTAGRRLSEASNPTDYQAVGLACRDAQISYANAVYSPDFVPDGEDEPAWDHSQRQIELTLSHFGALTGSDKARQFSKKAWALAVSLQHEHDVTEREAERCLFATVVAITEVHELVKQATANARWMEKYGVYKCPACGSTALAEDVDSDGTMSGTHFLACENCSWVA